MSKKLSFEEAAQVMRAAKLEPLDEYPGRAKPWKCKCLSCGKIVSPSLGAVKTNGGGCRACGLKKSANSRRVSQEIAFSLMKAAKLTPIEPYTTSQKPWLCLCDTCGREVNPTLSNIKQGHAGCVYCAGKKVHPDDAVKFMENAGLTPLEPYPGSNSKWKCRHNTCGEIVFPAYSWILSGQGGCKQCGYKENQKKQLGDGEEAKKFFLSKGFKPLEPYPGSGRPWKSRCLTCGFIVQPYYGRVKSGTGCGVCSKRIVVPARAVKIMKAAKLEPLEEFPGSKSKWRCSCLKCNREVSATYGDVLQGYGGCKYCGGHFVEPEAATLLMKSRGLIPQTPYKNSSTKWLCICSKCGREVFTRYNQIQRGQSGCPYCANRKVDSAEAEQVMLAAGVIPLVKYPGARVAWKCKCKKCGLVVFPFYSSVANIGSNPCIYCAGKKVDAKRAFQIMLDAELSPLEGYSKADVKWRCICNKCGKLVTPTYTSIRIGQGGCKYCVNKGLDYSAPSFLYLITNSKMNAHKIGVGNYKTRNNRIDEHKKTGWTLIECMDFETGEDAFEVEQQTLLWLRTAKKLPIYLSKKEMPQGGETETVDALEIDLPTIWAKVEELSMVKNFVSKT